MAGRSLGVLTLDLILKSGGFELGMDKAARTAEAKAKQINKSVTKLKKEITAGFVGLFAGISVSAIVSATAEAEESLARLNNAVKNNAGAAGTTTKELADFSSELQRVTTYSDETVQGMQSLLLTFRQIGGPEFKRAQIVTLDVATALGQDLNSAAKLVGKALADPVKGMTQLSRAGVILTKDQKEVIKTLAESGRLAEAQGIILKELESRFGGTAKAARDNFGGALQGLKNSIGDLLEVKGGLPGVTAGINSITDALNDPATRQAIDQFFSFIISSATLAIQAVGLLKQGITDNVFISTFAQISKGINVELGLVSDQVEKINQQIEFLEAEAKSFLPYVLAIGKSGLSPEGGIKIIDKKEIEKRIIELRKLQADILGLSATPPIIKGDGSSGAADPSEEFEKLQAQFLKQIALYGKVGEAAKLAYEIQIGSLEGLTDAEGKELIALAKRLDGLAASAKAAEDAAKIEKEAQQVQEAALKNIEVLIQGLELQVATYDKSASAVLRYRIEQGDLAKTFADAGAAAVPYKEQLIALTAKMTALEKGTEEAKKQQQEFDQLMSEGKSVIEATRTPLEKLNAEYERLNKLRDAGALGAGSEGDETYRRAIEAAQEAFDKGSKDSEAFNEQFKDGIFRSLQEGIYTGITDGAKSGWKGFLEAGLNTINQLVAAALAKKLAESLFGDEKEGSGGFLNSVIGALFGPGKASGGPVSAGTIYPVNERELEFFKPNSNGRIIPLAQMPPSSVSGGVEQNIYVQGRVDARTASQLATKTAQRQRIATARLG